MITLSEQEIEEELLKYNLDMKGLDLNHISSALQQKLEEFSDNDKIKNITILDNKEKQELLDSVKSEF